MHANHTRQAVQPSSLMLKSETGAMAALGSRSVLALTDLGKHFPGRAVRKPDRFCYLRHISAQERVRFLFLADGRRNGRLVGGEQLSDLGLPRIERRVAGLDRFRKANVGLGVFVPAIDPGVV